LVVSASKLAKKPSNISYQETGAVAGGATPALLGIRDLAKAQKGQKILIIGASGGIGTFGVQLAKLYETEVTGVCGSNNLDMVKEIGADFVIDYTKVDYTKNNEAYDIIFDTIGANTFSNCKNILTENGVYVSNNMFSSKKHILQIITSNFTSKKLKVGQASESADNYNSIGDWIEQGKIKPIIDKVYPIDLIADAHRHYETGHSKGRVVITID
jgi:NADPH2:quinone reductase